MKVLSSQNKLLTQIDWKIKDKQFDDQVGSRWIIQCHRWANYPTDKMAMKLSESSFFGQICPKLVNISSRLFVEGNISNCKLKGFIWNNNNDI